MFPPCQSIPMTLTLLAHGAGSASLRTMSHVPPLSRRSLIQRISALCLVPFLHEGIHSAPPTPTPKAEASPRFDPIEKTIEGWTVRIDPSLLNVEDHDESAQALKMLANHLQRISILVTGERLTQLRSLPIWIEKDHPSLRNMQYHPSKGWLTANGHDPRLTRHVHIPVAKHLLSRGQMLKHPAVVLHELAHAYHDQILSFEEPRIVAAFEEAKKRNLYADVLLYTGKRVRHYGLTNHKEYFAEGTEAFLYRNDFFPFVRAELKEYDPTFHDLLESIWGKPE